MTLLPAGTVSTNAMEYAPGAAYTTRSYGASISADAFVQGERPPADHRFAALGVDAVDVVAAQVHQQADDVAGHAVLARIGGYAHHRHAVRRKETAEAVLVGQHVVVAFSGGGKLGKAVHRHEAPVFGKYDGV